MYASVRALKTVREAAECVVAALTFRCITFVDNQPNGIPAYTTLLVTGYRNHILFVKADWNGRVAEPREAEAYIGRLLLALMR